MSSTSSGHLLVASAQAGSTEEETLAAVAEVLGAELALCTQPDDIDIAIDRLEGRTLVIAGGDGSLHLAVTRLRDRGLLGSTRVALVPLGTGNDLARSLGLPLDPVGAAHTVMNGNDQPIDLLVDDRGSVVVNAAHVGIGAEAAHAAGRLKPRLGPLAYPIGAVAAAVRVQGWRLRVVVDGRVVASGRRRLLMVGVCNAQGIGGGTPLAPGAVPDDGLLDVVVSEAIGPVARLRYGLLLRLGRHVRSDDVRTFRGRTVTISGTPVEVNADGDILPGVRERTWRVEPGAYRLVRPGPTPAP